MKVLKNVVFLFLLTILIISCNSTQSCDAYIGSYTDSEVNENTHCAKHLEISKVKGGFLVKQTMEQRMNIKCNHQWDSEAIYECKEGILVNEDDGKKKRLILEEGGGILREGTGTQKWLRDNQGKEGSSNKEESTNISDSEGIINEIKEHYTTIYNGKYTSKDYETMCSSLTYFLEGSEIVRINESIHEPGSQSSENNEYYFWEGKLFFIFTNYTSYGNSTGEIEEHRFYISNEKAILCKEKSTEIDLKTDKKTEHENKMASCNDSHVDNVVIKGKELKNLYSSASITQYNKCK